MLPSWMRSRTQVLDSRNGLARLTTRRSCSVNSFLARRLFVLAGGDDFERATELLAARLGPAASPLHGALRLANAGGDVEQFSREPLTLSTWRRSSPRPPPGSWFLERPGRILVVLNDLMGVVNCSS